MHINIIIVSFFSYSSKYFASKNKYNAYLIANKQIGDAVVAFQMQLKADLFHKNVKIEIYLSVLLKSCSVQYEIYTQI